MGAAGEGGRRGTLLVDVRRDQIVVRADSRLTGNGSRSASIRNRDRRIRAEGDRRGLDSDGLHHGVSGRFRCRISIRAKVLRREDDLLVAVSQRRIGRKRVGQDRLALAVNGSGTDAHGIRCVADLGIEIDLAVENLVAASFNRRGQGDLVALVRGSNGRCQFGRGGDSGCTGNNASRDAAGRKRILARRMDNRGNRSLIAFRFERELRTAVHQHLPRPTGTLIYKPFDVVVRTKRQVGARFLIHDLRKVDLGVLIDLPSALLGNLIRFQDVDLNSFDIDEFTNFSISVAGSLIIYGLDCVHLGIMCFEGDDRIAIHIHNSRTNRIIAQVLIRV